MNNKIVISLTGSWVLEHRDDDLLPVEFLKKEITDTKKVSFYLENTLHEIEINDERKTYIDEDKYKIIIIELIIEDNLNSNNFFELEKKEKIEATE